MNSEKLLGPRCATVFIYLVVAGGTAAEFHQELKSAALETRQQNKPKNCKSDQLWCHHTIGPFMIAECVALHWSLIGSQNDWFYLLAQLNLNRKMGKKCVLTASESSRHIKLLGFDSKFKRSEGTSLHAISPLFSSLCSRLVEIRMTLFVRDSYLQTLFQ